MKKQRLCFVLGRLNLQLTVNKTYVRVFRVGSGRFEQTTSRGALSAVAEKQKHEFAAWIHSHAAFTSSDVRHTDDATQTVDASDPTQHDDAVTHARQETNGGKSNSGVHFKDILRACARANLPYVMTSDITMDVPPTLVVIGWQFAHRDVKTLPVRIDQRCDIVGDLPARCVE